jgi:hypothetical protein
MMSTAFVSVLDQQSLAFITSLLDTSITVSRFLYLPPGFELFWLHWSKVSITLG